MGRQLVEEHEFEFPDGDEAEATLEIEVEDSSAVELFGDNSDEFEVGAAEEKSGKSTGAGDDDSLGATDEDLEEYSSKVRDRLKNAAEQAARDRDTATRRAEEAEQRAERLSNENQSLKGNVSETQQALLEQAKKVANSELQEAKKKYIDATEAGDTEAQADAQSEMMQATIKVREVNNYKLPAGQEDGEGSNVQTTSHETTVEAPVVDVKAQKWRESNEWFGADEPMTAYALGVHSKLVKAGYNPKTDEYYEAIDTQMKKTFAEYFGDSENKKPSKERMTSSTVVAPTSRGGPGNKVQLTQTQVALAKRMGVPLAEYAKHVALQMRREQNGR